MTLSMRQMRVLKELEETLCFPVVLFSYPHYTGSYEQLQGELHCNYAHFETLKSSLEQEMNS
jgi:hypothetical protein